MPDVPQIAEPTLNALSFGQLLWSPDEAHPETTPTTTRVRGNGTRDEQDVTRGEEQLARVLGW